MTTLNNILSDLSLYRITVVSGTDHEAIANVTYLLAADARDALRAVAVDEVDSTVDEVRIELIGYGLTCTGRVTERLRTAGG